MLQLLSFLEGLKCVFRFLLLFFKSLIFLSFLSGYGPLPCAVKGEVFPANVKGISSAVTVGYSWGLSFVITKLFPHIKEDWGMFTVFWIFSVSCFLASLFSIFIMIDTRDMSLQDIQDLLNNKKKKSSEPVAKITSLQEVSTIS